MRTTSTVLFLAVTTFAVKAGEFINLDFEQANTNYMAEVSYLGYIGRPEDLLPGWTLVAVDRPVVQVGFNLFPLDGPVKTLIDHNNPYGQNMPVLGAYALFLEPASRPYHLTQAGEIPTDALSIEFAVYGAPWKLQANGQPIPLTYGPYSGPMTFHTARGDISAFAGTTTELIFTTRGTSGVDYTVIDNIAFSSKAIPEPSTWALLGLGGLGLWWMRRRSRPADHTCIPGTRRSGSLPIRR